MVYDEKITTVELALKYLSHLFGNFTSNLLSINLIPFDDKSLTFYKEQFHLF